MRSLVTILSVLFLVIAGAVIAPFFIDLDRFKDPVLETIEQQTGYQIDLAGDVDIALLPKPTVTATDISITKIGYDAPFLSMKQAKTSVALMPLLSGQVQISAVHLVAPQADLISGSDGDNFMPVLTNQQGEGEQTDGSGEAEAAEAAEAKAEQKISIDLITIDKGRVSFNGTEISLNTLKLRMESLIGPFDVAGNLAFQGMSYDIDGSIGALAEGEALPVQLDVVINDGMATSSVSGSLANLSEGAESVTVEAQASLSVAKLSDVASALSGAGLPEAIAGKGLELRSGVTGNMQRLRLDQGALTFNRETIALSGDITNLSNPASMATALTLSDLPGGGTVRISHKAQDLGLVFDGFTMHPVLVEWLGLIPDSAGTQAMEGRLDGAMDITLAKNRMEFALKSLKLDGAAIDASGKVLNPNTDQMDVTLAFKTKALDSLMRALNQKPIILMGETVQSVQADLAYQGGMGQGDYTVELSALGFSVGAKGQISEPLSGQLPETASLSLKHPNAAAAIRRLVPGISPDVSGDFALQAALKARGKAYDLTGLKMDVGPVSVTGSAGVDLSGAKPSLKADLRANSIPLDAFMGGNGKTSSSGGSSSASAGASSSSAGPWSREAMNTEALRSANLDVALAADKITYEQWVLGNVSAKIGLNNGRLSVAPVTADVFGGALDMRLGVDATEAGKPVRIDEKLVFTNVQMGPLVRALTKQSKDSLTGVGSLDLDLRGEGISTSALAFSLAGQGRLQMADPVVHGIDLEGLDRTLKDMNSSNILSSLMGAVDKSLGGGQTAFKDINHPFTVTQGTVTLDNFILETANDTGLITTNGTISLSEWLMDLTTVVELKREAGMPLATITLKGPLNAPQKSVKSDAVRALINDRWGDKIGDTLDDVIGERGSGLIQNLLGVGRQPATEQDNTAPAEDDVKSEASESKPKSTEQILEEEAGKLIRGLFD